VTDYLAGPTHGKSTVSPETEVIKSDGALLRSTGSYCSMTTTIRTTTSSKCCKRFSFSSLDQAYRLRKRGYMRSHGADHLELPEAEFRTRADPCLRPGWRLPRSQGSMSRNCGAGRAAILIKNGCYHKQMSYMRFVFILAGAACVSAQTPAPTQRRPSHRLRVVITPASPPPRLRSPDKSGFHRRAEG